MWHQDHCQFAVYPCEKHGTGAGSLLWKHRDRSAAPGSGSHIHRVGVCFQEGSVDLVPLEDEWNERRRIQMTSVGFKGKNKSACMIFFFAGGWVMWLSGSWRTTELFSPDYRRKRCPEGLFKIKRVFNQKEKWWHVQTPLFLFLFLKETTIFWSLKMLKKRNFDIRIQTMV